MDFALQRFAKLEPVPPLAHDHAQQQGRFALVADQKGRGIFVSATNLGDVSKTQGLAVGDDRNVSDLVEVIERAVDANLHLRSVRFDRSSGSEQVLL